ncbi:sulfotransferase domain-containing protein [Streptomyces atriruber]|uniref:sulfotransferase domain-containing protein n=1 Tax=Streptomyces atriruber TaxID=545121 RepID=UPI0006E14B65|nr:sulfotransferase domain-containing protein [Streptomyces atriruber]
MTEDSARELRPDELARRSARLLGEHDIVVAGDPGSGQALVANIVFELGFDYLDPYVESPEEADGASKSVEDRLDYYRQRLAATSEKSQAALDRAASGAVAKRFIKTHFYPEVFAESSVNTAILVVRDPRDTIYSSYKWFSSFGGSWIPDAADMIGKLTYPDFLDRVRLGDGEPSIPGWARFYRSWLEASPDFSKFAVVRFEDLKSHPVGAITAMLAALGLAVPPEVVEQAAERSSFKAMRAREDAASAGEGDTTKNARIMRRGQVGEWREWIGEGDLRERFAHPGLVATAARFGYDATPTE